MSALDQPDEGSSVSRRKVDPDSLVLRGRPRPVARFRKSVVVGATALVSSALIALTWSALKPSTARMIAASDSSQPFSRSSPEALRQAPRDYRDVPKLGPPLPGDLGRPILERQREMAIDPGVTPVPPRDVAAERRATEAERRAELQKAALSSALLVQASKGVDAPATASPSEALPAPEPIDGRVRLGDWGSTDINPHLKLPPRSRYVLAAGSIIEASLVTGLNSDLPGLVVAQVSANVRDSVSGGQVLIPQGARLIGRYDSKLGYGQRRAFLIWQRILFPDGSSIRLDNMPASDASGAAGLSDRVDGHSWQILKGVVLSSLLSAGSQLSLGNDGGIARAIRDSAQQNGSRAGEQIVGRGLDVQPTVKVRPGWPVRVLVSEDLLLDPWKG